MKDTGISVALSGGGFRATLFNLGALWRLNDGALLPQVRRITSVSGGSIASGVLGLHWSALEFRNGVAANFRSVVAEPLMRFCLKGIDTAAGIGGLLSLVDSIADKVQEKYAEGLFGAATLQDLPAEGAGPAFVFYATSLQTGSSVRMSRKYLADYKIGRLDRPAIALARAVAASSAFPPVLSPVTIETDPRAWTATEGAYLFGQEKLRRRLVLTDGGVYDNMGMEAIWERYETVLVSDAGAPLDVEVEPSAVWHKQALRVMDICTDQQRALRKRVLVQRLQEGSLRGAYWGIGTAIVDYGLNDTLCRDSAASVELAGMRTRLDRFSEREQGQLINWGYAMADAALRRYLEQGGARGVLPLPEFAL
jgi:NTE family protein